MNERIKELRLYLNLNQTEFGERIGVKQSAIAGYETGGRTPMNPVVEAICRVYGVSKKWLLNGDGDMFISRPEAITIFMAGLLKEDDSSFKKKFIESLAQLPEEKWDWLEEFMVQLVNKQD